MEALETKSKRAPRTRGTGSLFKRNGSAIWSMKYKDVRGRFVVKSTFTTSKKEAADKLRDEIEADRKGLACGSKVERTTLAELAEDLFRDYRVNGMRSLDDLQTRWKLHLEPFFGAARAVDITYETITKYVDRRKHNGAANGTINRELAALKRMFSLGLRGGKVVRMPQFQSHLKESAPRSGFVSDSDYAKLAEACSRLGGLWFRALFETGYTLGWRVHELLNLRVEQVDLINRTVRLDAGQTKNGEPRVASIGTRIYRWLMPCVTGKDADRYVFSRDEDGWRPVRDFRVLWYRACVAAGVGKLSCPQCTATLSNGQCPQCKQDVPVREWKYEGLIFHDLRRTAVRNMVRAGIPERVAMTISGHLTRSIFDRYSIVSESDLHEAASKLDARAKAVNDAQSAESMQLGIQLQEAAKGRGANQTALPN